MTVLTCPTRERLTQYVLGKLPEAEIDALAGHTEDCLRCQGMLDTLDGLTDELVCAVRQRMPEDSPSADLELRELVAKVAPLGSQLPRHPDSGDFTEPKAGIESEASELSNGWLGQYRLLERLGRGGMGTVYKALHTKLKRIVAVKVLPAKRLAHPRAVALFQREMEAVGKFDHPNIVRAHDAGEANGQHYLVMELVEGINLSRLVRTCGPLPVAVACELVLQAAVGLQHAHEHGLVHRDVKPSNLMVTPDGTVKVLDLGLARLLADALESDAQRQPLILGSLEYMAPEQGLDPRNVEHRADIYSLGCTLYCLLAGKPPFLDSGNDTLSAKIRTHAEALATPINHIRPDVPEEIVSLLSSMMAKRPGDRPANMSVVAAALAPLAQHNDLVGFLADHQALLRAVSLPDQAFGSQHVELSQHGESNPEAEARPRMWQILWFVVGLVAMLLLTVTANYTFGD